MLSNLKTNRTITISGVAIPKKDDGTAIFKLREIMGEEALSESYKYYLDLTTAIDIPDNEAANLNLQMMLGKELTVTIQLDSMKHAFSGKNTKRNIDSEYREISGIVTEARLVEQHDRYYLYRIVIEPWIVLAKYHTDYRIYQKKTVIDIISEVLNSHHVYLSYVKRLRKQYPLIEYEVQYGESDYDFVQRLMERYGLYWFFEHTNNIHRMVLIDDMDAHTPVVNNTYHVLFWSPLIKNSEREFIHYFEFSEQLHPGNWTTDDFNFMQPEADLSVSSSKTKTESTRQLSIYEWPGNYSDLSLGSEYSRVRMEEIYARGWHASGQGNIRNVVCGTTFELQDHPKKAANGIYLVIRSRLEAKEIGEASSSGEYMFKADFDVQPIKIAYRPERKTPAPRTTGPQTAIVTGPAKTEIWTDEYGRVKLKFHWDRSSKCNQDSSCWVRVSYPWAGNNFGGINIPRVGSEVIVDFENGDPNRPIITGRVYNAATMPPWALPANATQSGIISRSLGGILDKANALRFEDRQGSEEIWLQAERDMLIEVKNNEVHRVQADRSKSIGGNEVTTVQGTRTETVFDDEKIALQSNRNRTVAKDDNLNIGGNQSTIIRQNQKHEVQQDYTKIIGGNDSLEVTGERQLRVAKNQHMEVQHDLQEQVNGNRFSQTGKTYSIQATDKIEIIVGSSSLTLESNGNININGKNITISGDSVKVEGNNIDLN